MWPKFGSYPNLHVNLFSFIFWVVHIIWANDFQHRSGFLFFFRGRDTRPHFFFFFFSTINSKYVCNKILPMTRFEPQISGIGSTALPTEPHQLPFLIFLLVKKCTKVNKDISQNKMSYATHKKRKQTRCQEDPLGFSGSDNAVHFFVKFLLMLFSFV